MNWSIATKQISVVECQISGDEKLLVCNGMDDWGKIGSLTVFDVDTGSRVKSLLPDEIRTSSVFCLRFSPDSKHLIASAVNPNLHMAGLNEFRIWEVANWKRVGIFHVQRDSSQKGLGIAKGIAFTDNGKKLVMSDGNLMVFDWQDVLARAAGK